MTRTVALLHGALDQVADTPMWTMGPAEAGRTLAAVTRLAARVAELELRVAAHAHRTQAAAATGATSTGSWWADQTRQTRTEAHRKMALAEALDTRWERVRHALADGALLPDQAQVIAAALQALPVDVAPEVVARAEQTLVGYAADHDAKALRILGRRVLDIVAPHIAEAHEAKLLADQDRHAEASMRLTMAEDGHGCIRGRFTLPTLHGHMLRKALHALTPHHTTGQSTTGQSTEEDAGHATGPAAEEGAAGEGAAGEGAAGERERLSGPERMGRAFAEYIERYPTHALPKTGGTAATVVVTITLDQLLNQLHGHLHGQPADPAATSTNTGTGAATRTGPGFGAGFGAAALDTGEVISAATARRLACQAGIIPAVLGGPSQVLDLGRRRRFHTEPQRLALALRDQGCTAHGCDWPPGLCHAHHQTPWSQGGHTSLDQGRLLCPRHHTRAHDPGYTTTHLPGGKITFHRRT
ncbi:MAG TPA: DUF222 domain-containing protein [Acidimicrobiales bacterium]|nr:DUF222 domain-containing protein [Acidimicrobiales bacterium]